MEHYKTSYIGHIVIEVNEDAYALQEDRELIIVLFTSVKQRFRVNI